MKSTYNTQKTSICLYKYIKPFDIEEFKLLLQIADQDSLNQALYEASRKDYDTKDYVKLLLTKGAKVGYLILKNAFEQKYSKFSDVAKYDNSVTNYDIMIGHLIKNPGEINFAILNFLFKEDIEFFSNKECIFLQENLYDITKINAESSEKAKIKIKIIKEILKQGVPTEQLKLECFDNEIKAYVIQARIISKLFTGRIANAAEALKNIIEKVAQSNNLLVDYEVIIGCFNMKTKELLKMNNQNTMINLLKKMEDNGFFKVSVKLDKNLGTILYNNSLLKLIWKNPESTKNNYIPSLKFISLNKVIDNIDWQKIKISTENYVSSTIETKPSDRIAELFNSLRLGFEVNTISELYKLPMKKLSIQEVSISSINNDNILDLYPQNSSVGEINFGIQEHLEYCF